MSDPNTSPSGCGSCSLQAQLAQMGVSLGNYDHLVALAGNPNTGKSSVFNALTGLRQHVGNWTGKTVTRAEGGYRFEGASYKLVDLPGTYSLLSASQDEEISRNFFALWASRLHYCGRRRHCVGAESEFRLASARDYRQSRRLRQLDG